MERNQPPASRLTFHPGMTQRYSKDEWEAKRSFITTAYRVEKMTLKQISELLKENHDFIANERQLKGKIKKWRLDKNLKASQVRAMLRKRQERQEMSNKRTVFRVRGEIVDEAKIDRWQKRSENTGWLQMIDPTASSAPPTPSDISYSTISELGSPSPSRRNREVLKSMSTNRMPPAVARMRSPVATTPRFHDQLPTVRGHYPQFLVKSPRESDLGPLVAPQDNDFNGRTCSPDRLPTLSLQDLAPFDPNGTSQRDWNLHLESDYHQNILAFQQKSPVRRVSFGSACIPRYAAGPLRVESESLTASLEPRQKLHAERYLQKRESELVETLNERQAKFYSNHPSILEVISLLASVFEQQGRFQSAERLRKREVKAWEETFGQNDPRTLIALSRLASVFAVQGKWVSAEKFSRVAYTKASGIMPPSSPDLLFIMGSRANCLHFQGKEHEALQMFRQLLRSGRSFLHPETPLLLEVMENIAILLRNRGEYHEAESILRELITTNLLCRGADHLITLRTQCLMGHMLLLKLDARPAHAALSRAFEGLRRFLGPENLQTLVAQSCLAYVLRSLGKHLECEALLRDALEKRFKVVGCSHPDTLENEVELAHTLNHQRRYNEAMMIARKVLEKCERFLRSDHKTTLLCRVVLGHAFHKLGSLDEAFSLLDNSLRGLTVTLGQDHPVTKYCRGLKNALVYSWEQRG